MQPRLGVNIDHVATLRQQRGEDYPSIRKACELSLLAGADQITIHLREDRRHIQDRDVGVVQTLCREHRKLFNLEMGCHDEMIDLAARIHPDWVCLVPEKREEKTTEGGLDLEGIKNFERVKKAMEIIWSSSPKTKISLFVEADQKTMEQALKLKAQAVEIHTGDFAKASLEGKSLEDYFELYKKAHALWKNDQRSFHAGHGLTDKSVVPLLKLNLFEEYNIGHWIISESVFEGLGVVVERLNKIIKAPY